MGAAEKPIRVLLIAPSMDILGGQAVQAERLLTRLRQEPSLEMGFLPINPCIVDTACQREQDEQYH